MTLRRLLAVQFTERATALKARSALLGLDRLVREHLVPGSAAISMAVERTLAGAHEFRELGLLSRPRSPDIALPNDLVTEAERLLGGSGTSFAIRLGVHGEASVADLRSQARDAVRRWRVLAEDPLNDRPTVAICQAVARNSEGVLAVVPA